MRRLSSAFCTASKNYVNQFKVRSRLAEFFKHIHPDQMGQAPTKIKEENLRSLKNFNSYLDSINQEKPIEGKLLKFYISEKSNNKSRKFFSFNLELPELNSEQARMNEDKAGKLIDDIVNALNHKFRESRGILEGKKPEKVPLREEEGGKVETREEKVGRLQETAGPFQRPSHQREAEEERLRQAINAKFMETEREDLKLQLRKRMSFANTSTNKPMMWSRMVMGEAGIYGDYQQILQHLIDPKLIYFSEHIALPEIEQFKRKMLPGELDRLGVRATQAVIQVCEEMESYSPPLCLFVTTHYSATEIPGFFSIPYSFKPVDLLEQFQQCKSLILQERAKYEQQYDSYQELARGLLEDNRMRVKGDNFRNNADISSRIISLKRLGKHKLESLLEVHLMEGEDYKILCKEYQLEEGQSVHLLKGKLFSLTGYKEEEMSLILEGLSRSRSEQAA